MHGIRRTFTLIASFSLFLNVLFAAAQDLPADLPRGKTLYQNHCAPCHGQTGRGEGPAAASLRIAPTNFHQFRFFLKSDEDLLRIIEYGMSFSPMHAWSDNLTEKQIVDVLAYVRMLSQEDN